MNQKIENELNLSLGLDNEERSKTDNLNTGYDESTGKWELIIKYSGEIRRDVEALGGTIIELLGGYGIVTIPESNISQLANLNNVLLVEKADRLFYETEYSKLTSCITEYRSQHQSAQSRQTGNGSGNIFVDTILTNHQFRSKL